MVWRDKAEQCLLTGLRLYFLPENTPTGRRNHGEVSSELEYYLLLIHDNDDDDTWSVQLFK